MQLVEALYRQRWNRLDGLGALVVSPTRELAVQIFEELRKVGRRHELSAGLLIGGKDVAEEAALVAGLNILVATPGRLLQHLDETPGFDPGSLQVLVLDEADRILDMVGFLPSCIVHIYTNIYTYLYVHISWCTWNPNTCLGPHSLPVAPQLMTSPPLLKT